MSDAIATDTAKAEELAGLATTVLDAVDPAAGAVATAGLTAAESIDKAVTDSVSAHAPGLTTAITGLAATVAAAPALVAAAAPSEAPAVTAAAAKATGVLAILQKAEAEIAALFSGFKL